MRVRGVALCALLFLAAGQAEAVDGANRPRGRGWVHRSDAARSLEAMERARAASRAATGAGALRPAAGLSGDPRARSLGTEVWTTGGIPVCPAGQGQFDPTAVSDNGEGVVVAWIDLRDLDYDVYAMKLDGNGNQAWPAAGVVLSATDSVMLMPRAMPDGSGGAFVIFGQFSGAAYSNVIVQRVTSAGAVAPGWPANGLGVAPGGAEGYGAVPTNDGFLLMGWSDLAGQLRVQRVTGAGALAPGWNPGGLAIGAAGNSGDVGVAPDGAGGAYICWDENSAVMLTRVTSGGVAADGWTLAGTTVATGTSIPFGLGAAPLPGNEVMVLWPDIRNFTSLDIYAQRYTGAGAIAGGWPATGAAVLTSPNNEQLPDAVADGAGGAVLVCQVGAADSVVAQRITGAGALAAGWSANGVTLARHPGKTSSNATSDGTGGILVAWSAIEDVESDIFASRAAPGGTVAAGWPDEVCGESGNQYDPVIVTDGAGGMIAVWEDDRESGTQHIYAARVLSDGTVGAQAALVAASAEPGLARLHWYSPGGATFEAALERARGEGAFLEIARLTPEAGHLRYDDHDVVAGETYRYRLAVFEGGAVHYLGAVTLRVPDGRRLALAGFVPNPAVGAPRLAYALPSAEPARIEVLDAAGRRVFERALHATPGEHVAAFEGPALAPGVYVLRLTQGSRSVTARAAVVR